jgi:quercetin dioxygenase-like cupin family protein
MLAMSVAFLAAPAVGQEQTVKRTELMRVPVEGFEGKEGVIYTADFAPGATAPRHTHPGQEFVYVLQGSLVIEPDGEAAQTVKAGETVTQPPNRVHGARNGSASEPAKVLVFLLLDKGKPLAIPVQ